MTKKDRSSPATEDMDLRQAQLYARDLHELYLAERQKRRELAEQKLVLEYKLRELAALNTQFQSHLKRRYAAEEQYACM